MVFTDGEWIIITPEGYYNSSLNGHKHLNIRMGNNVYGIDQFYDIFYRPDIVTAKLKGDDISRLITLTIDEAIKNPPPQVTILSPKEGDTFSNRTANIKVEIKDTGGGIGDIRVYHNGKLVDSLGVYRFAKPEPDDGQTRMTKADKESPYQIVKRGTALRRIMGDRDKKDIRKFLEFIPIKGTVKKTYDITLLKGENIISVSAFNGENTVMSVMESIRINADIPERRPEVFVLSLGNDHFADTSYNLRMAIKDSKDFSDIMKKVAAPLYEKVHIQNLIDARKTSIIEAITSMATQMKPEDIFVFFAATHGRAEDDLYYIYTSDLDGNLRNPKNYISSVELMELSKRIPALKQVFVLDTCQSGGVGTIVSGLYDARISVLARALGMHIFAGAKTYQEAQDDYKGNGLFTYFVLRGLEGQADGDNNKEISVFEMNPYLSRSVKDASNGSQEPFIRNFGDDLPISKIINQSHPSTNYPLR